MSSKGLTTPENNLEFGNEKEAWKIPDLLV